MRLVSNSETQKSVRWKPPAWLALGVGVLLGASGTLLFQTLTLKPVDKDNPTGSATVTKYTLDPPPATVPKAYFVAPPMNNSCLIPSLQIPKGPQTFDACKFVIESTDQIWNIRDDVVGSIEKYFHDDYLDAGSWGKRIVGKKALKEAVFSMMRAFPDIQIHITDCICNGNDLDGYKCAMPDILIGTNDGPSGYGPPTGKRVRWTGLVQSFVYKNANKSSQWYGQWQYYGEWGVHDEWALIQQLGLDFSRVPHPLYNGETFHDCEPLQRWAPWGVFDAPDEVSMGLRPSAVLGAR